MYDLLAYTGNGNYGDIDPLTFAAGSVPEDKEKIAGTVCCAIANRYLQSANTDYQPNVRKLIELSLDRLTR